MRAESILSITLFAVEVPECNWPGKLGQSGYVLPK